MLADRWLGELEAGRVLRFYPFLGIMQSLLKNEKSGLRCGAGWAHYAIQTDGSIVPCPVMAGMKKFYAGSLCSEPGRLKRFYVGEPCISCKTRGLCGGRCLFANAHKFWDSRQYAEVCGTVKHLISEMQRIMPDVEKLVEKHVMSLDELNYTKFNSCEIIP